MLSCVLSSFDTDEEYLVFESFVISVRLSHFVFWLVYLLTFNKNQIDIEVKMSDTDRSRVDTQARGYNLRSKTRDEHAIPAASRVLSSPIRDDINSDIGHTSSRIP